MRRTFLFTDIEGSTPLLEEHGEVYTTAQSEHRRLLRKICAGRSGDEVGTAGDGYFAAFATAADAVAAAIECQQALRAHVWPAGCELRVRMGLHTGEATSEGGDYAGLAVHTAARVSAAAHGGQILLSEVTAQEVGGTVALQDLGRHRLRGVSEPVGLHQVLHPHLPASFAPPKVAPDLDPQRRQSISVLLVDDQELVRTGFRMILSAVDGLTVVGEASTGTEAIAAVARLHPDVVLMDIRMPEMDGIVATRAITADPAGPRVVILTTFDRDEYVYDALQAGASGFLLKDAPPADVVRAIHVVIAGDALLAPSITRRLVAEFSSGTRRTGTERPSPELARLSERELEVLSEIAKGASNAEIASTLFISETTVKSHVRSILTKCDARDRVQLVVLAYEAGLVTRRPG
jgi:DNA-binding NarL/FixJ family response regulator/class 3 adenylate cyclase